MFKITYETVYDIMDKALSEIYKNPIHLKWLHEYNLGLAFSSHVSFILAKDYDTILNDKDLEFLVRGVCEFYLESLETWYA